MADELWSERQQSTTLSSCILTEMRCVLLLNFDLQTEIEMLIQSKREDEYWDFKEKHHDNKADLLHDIICMANSRADRDRYILSSVLLTRPLRLLDWKETKTAEISKTSLIS